MDEASHVTEKEVIGYCPQGEMDIAQERTVVLRELFWLMVTQTLYGGKKDDIQTV
jgi:hypothetical protein